MIQMTCATTEVARQQRSQIAPSGDRFLDVRRGSSTTDGTASAIPHLTRRRKPAEREALRRPRRAAFAVRRARRQGEVGRGRGERLDERRLGEVVLERDALMMMMMMVTKVIMIMIMIMMITMLSPRGCSRARRAVPPRAATRNPNRVFVRDAARPLDAKPRRRGRDPSTTPQTSKNQRRNHARARETRLHPRGVGRRHPDAAAAVAAARARPVREHNRGGVAAERRGGERIALQHGRGARRAREVADAQLEPRDRARVRLWGGGRRRHGRGGCAGRRG